MKNKIHILSLFFVLFSVTTFSQTNTEAKKNVTKTIENYFYGYINRDASLLFQAFDLENGTMKVPKKENGVTVGFRNRYFKEVVPKWGNRKKLPKAQLDNCKLDILSLEVIDDQMAIAKISMKVDTVIYIDLLSVQKIDGDWKITNKTYTVRD